jgi:hypothetical protein
MFGTQFWFSVDKPVSSGREQHGSLRITILVQGWDIQGLRDMAFVNWCPIKECITVYIIEQMIKTARLKLFMVG